MKAEKTTFLFILLVTCHLLQGQNQAAPSLYSSFDKAVGLKNLGINNGTIHINNYRPADDTHRYLMADRYRVGSVVYDGQPYNDVDLKYDIVKDILIAKINGQNNLLGINLITEKTAFFTLDGKKFINLAYKSKVPQFIKGFYEEAVAEGKLALYIKYHKDAIEVLRTENVFYKFEEAPGFIITYNNNYYEIDDERDFVKFLPKYEKEIDDAYLLSKEAARTDKILFIKNMVRHLNNFLIKETK